MFLKSWEAVSTLDRVLDDVMGTTLGTATNSRSFVPEVDVRTTDNEIHLICDVPGLKREDIDVVLENNVLTIKGARNFESRENEQVVLGRSYGGFARQFRLPDWLDEEHLAATLADGVLTISIPRHEKSKPIKIQVGGDGSDGKQLEK